MNFQPTNFYITIVDLFAVLLPGSLAILLALHYAPDGFKLTEVIPNKDLIYGFFFLLSSYLAGHVIHQIGSIVDDLLYDPFKDLFFPKTSRLEEVKEIRKIFHGHTPSKSGVASTFEWSIFKMQSDNTPVYTEVEKTMAESKFFRGLLVVLFIFACLWLYNHTFSKLSLMSYGVLISIYLLSNFQQWINKLNSTKEKFLDKVDDTFNYKLPNEKNKSAAKKEVLKDRCRISYITEYSPILRLLKKFLFIPNGTIKVIPAEKEEQYSAQAKLNMRSAGWIALAIVSILLLLPIILNYMILNTTLWIIIGLVIFSLMRYFNKRHKSTQTAYKYIIFSHKLNKHSTKKDKETKSK